MSYAHRLNVYQPQALAVLRIVTAYMFIWHGTTKLFHIPDIEMFANVPLASMEGLAAIMEVVGAILLLLGLFTRPTAFVLSGLMAVAYFIGHAIPNGNVLLPILNHGELAVVWTFVFLYLSVAGGGAWALDNFRKR